MAAIRHCLQKELFEASAERLLVFCEVAKLLKRKKTCYLCLVSNTDLPSALTIYQVKKLDKNAFKKKRSWVISEIKSVDGGNDANVLTLDINADKLYRWVAQNEHDRHQFVIALSQVTVHNKDKIQFGNFPETWTASQNIQSPDSPLILPPQIVESENIIDYNALTDIEETELATLIGGCDMAIDNAEQFMQQLCDKLYILDGENIESMLASEVQVEALMSKLDEAISHAEVLEARLERYDDMLRHIRDTMDKMEEKNGMIETANRNSQKLLQQLENIVSWLDVTGVSMDVVLTTPEGREAALRAGNILRNALLTPQLPFMQRLSAVQEQLRKVNKYKDKFTQSVTRHLNNLLIHLSNDASQEVLPEGLSLPARSGIHSELRDYAALMHWMKQMDPKAYSALTKVYINSLSKLYDRDIRQFFENARQLVTSAVAAGNVKEKKSKHADDQSSNSSASQQFDSVMEQVLSQLEPVCLSEQEFFVYFFQVDISPLKSGQQSMEGSFTADSSGTITASPSTDDLLSTPTKDLSPGSSIGGGDQENKKAKDKAASELRKMMSELFPCLESELTSFISHYEKLDSYGSMRAVARLGSHVLSDETLSSQPSFPSWVFGACLVRAKRSADKAIGDKLKAMADAGRVTIRRNKCGVLPYVHEFEEFCTMAESIFGKSGRRADVDKWYVQIVSSMIAAIQHHEHAKTPQQVIRMENFHHLHDLLSQLKLHALDGLRKEAKIKYNEALKTYVTLYFGRPLEKLNQFFEGVQDRVNQGVKEDEISYQTAFSKQELRKVISMYPHKEVKKGLDSLYRKVEKHLCEEENLLQVVWRAMQEEFITQYKYLEERIQSCYPGSMIALDFAIQDILETFSEIARSH